MQRRILSYLLAMGAGAVLLLAFAPFNFYPIAIFSIAVLLFLWLKTTPEQAFWRGLFFGMGFFSSGVSWVYISIHQYGNSAAAVAVIVTILLILYLALFPAVQGYLLTKFFPHNNLRKLLLAFPASWVLLEWARTWVLTGFPWLFVGYSQMSSPLCNLAPIVGVYGVSFAVVFTGAALIAILTSKKMTRRFVIIALVAVLWIGSAFLTKINWTYPSDGTMKVALIQGNIPLEQKWDPKQLNKILDTYYQLTSKNWDNALIVWPEAAIPALQSDVKDYLKKLTTEAKEHNTTVLTGVPIYDEIANRYYNGIMAVGLDKGIYLKRHLVPFGEYVPFKPVLGWLHHLFELPMSDFSEGPSRQRDLIIGDVLVAPFICYEIAYPHLVLSYLPNAQLLITLCEDAWFGKSFAMDQHTEIAQMRSLETGRYQLLVTNVGITAVIDEKGRIITRAPTFHQEVVTSTDVRPMAGSTPWVLYGQYLWFLLALICLWIASVRR